MALIWSDHVRESGRLQILIESLGACGFSFFLSPPSPGRAERLLGEFHGHTEGICVPSAFWQVAFPTQELCAIASMVSTRSNTQTLAASRPPCRDTYDPLCGWRWLPCGRAGTKKSKTCQRTCVSPALNINKVFYFPCGPQ